MKKLLISLLALSLLTGPVLSAETCNFPLEVALDTSFGAGFVLDASYKPLPEAPLPEEVKAVLVAKEAVVTQFDQIFVFSNAHVQRRMFLFAYGACTIAVMGQDYVAS